MKQPVPERWSVPPPGRPVPGIVQLPPPLAQPPTASIDPSRTGSSLLVIASLAVAAAVAGAVLAGSIALVAGLPAGGTTAMGSGPSLTTSAAIAGLAATAEPLDPGAVVPIVVDVAGGVLHPGLRTMRDGDRVGDAIAAAGGFAPRADLVATSRVVNLAMPLTDGMKVLVPELGTLAAPDGRADAADDGLIDLNGADQAELETLPGIGPVTAAEIIDARAERPFASVEDLRDRDVVGDAVFERVRDLVRAGGG